MKTIHFFTIISFLLAGHLLNAQSYYQNIHSKPGHYQKGVDVIPVEDDLTFIAQTTFSQYEFNGQYWGWKDGFQLCKIDKDGNLVWDKLYSAGNAELYGSSLNSTSDDGYILAGNLFHTGPIFGYNYFPFLIKTDAQGNKQWLYAIYHNPPSASPLQNYDGSGFNYAEQNPRGNYITIGESTYSDNAGTSKTFVLVVEVGSTGNYIRKEKLIEFDRNARGVKIQAVEENGYIAVAELSDFSGQYNSTVLMRLDDNLNTVWKKEIRSNSFAVSPVDLLYSSEGKILVAGNLINNKNRIFLAQFNFSGQMQWIHDIDFSGEQTDLWLKSLAEDENGKLYLFGDVESTPMFGSGSERDVFSIVCSMAGVPVDGKLYGKQNRYESFGGGVAFTNGDHVGVGEINEGQAYIVKANAAGETSCDYYYIYPEKKSVDVEVSNISASLFTGAMFDAHYIEETYTDVTPNIDNCPLFPIGDIKEKVPTGQSSLRSDLATASVVFPNPTSGRFTIRLGNHFSDQERVKAHLLNLQGQVVRSFEWTGKQHEISINEDLQGIYLLQLQQGSVMDQQRIVFY